MKLGARFAVMVAIAWSPLIRAEARTIELTDNDCDRMAVIGPQSPNASWLMFDIGAGEFSTLQLDIKSERAWLIRYPLDRVPSGQRITRAEWVVPIMLVSPPGEHRLHVRRLIGPWGPGVSYTNRMLRPTPLPWTLPGAAALAADRANQATAVMRVSGGGEQIINVTEDVELWYTGAARNEGWIVTVEDPNILIRLNSPLWVGQGTFKLRITYEPE